jgi:hypothetical protein
MAGEEHSSRIPILDAAHEDTGKIRSVFDARLSAQNAQRSEALMSVDDNVQNDRGRDTTTARNIPEITYWKYCTGASEKTGSGSDRKSWVQSREDRTRA